MWIVIGVLLAVVVTFLVVASILDKKKTKKYKAEKEEKDKAMLLAGSEMELFISALIKENEKLLKNFTPSVGKLKMGDIRKKAKDAIKEFKESREYSYASNSEDNEFILKLTDELYKTNSNTWNKNFAKEIKKLELKVKEIDSRIKDDYKNKLNDHISRFY